MGKCNEVRWHPGQEASLAPPCSNLKYFGNNCSVLKKVLVTLLGILRSHSDSAPLCQFAPGELCPVVTPLRQT